MNTFPSRMCQVQRHGVSLPPAAIDKVRKLYAEAGQGVDPVQIAPDIWVSGSAVSGHRDSTAPGKVTYGIVLVADGYEPRIRYGTGNFGSEYAVEPGSIYVLDAREYHSLDYTIGRDGMLAFLAWDMPHDFTLQGFSKRALRSLSRWAKTTEPFLQPGAGI